LLQWGRRVNTAEWPATEKQKEALGKMLQWGRRVNTAEWELGRATLRDERTLQWGRRVNTAEWTGPAEGDHHANCFNGAAA
jgi:hypothetical protein